MPAKRNHRSDDATPLKKVKRTKAQPTEAPITEEQLTAEEQLVDPPGCQLLLKCMVALSLLFSFL